MTQHTLVPPAEAKNRVTKWFYHPRTPDLGWKQLSWRKIGDACDVSYMQARRYLPPLIMKKYGLTLDEINRMRWASAVVQNIPGIKRPKAEIKKIRKARKNMTLKEVADKFGLSPTTVQRYTGKKRKQQNE